MLKWQKQNHQSKPHKTHETAKEKKTVARIYWQEFLTFSKELLITLINLFLFPHLEHTQCVYVYIVIKIQTSTSHLNFAHTISHPFHHPLNKTKTKKKLCH